MVTIGIASLPTRKECLKKTLDSLYGQADLICVSLNGYDEIPKWNYPNVYFEQTSNEFGDAEKFRYADRVEGWYVAWDDDLQCHSTGIETLIEGAKKYNALVSFHGRVYTPPLHNFRCIERAYRVLRAVSEDAQVNFIGSGCCCFNTERLKVSMSDFKIKNMADVYLSKLATDQGVPMYVLKHYEGYVKYLNPPQGTTIWEQTKDYTEHLKIMQTFIK